MPKKTEELKQKTKEELNQLLREKKEKLSQFKFALASGKVKNVKEIHTVRKDIARILTLLK